MQDLSRTAGVPWGWSEGAVAESASHFGLHHGDPEGPVVARVGLSPEGRLEVEFLTEDADVLQKIRRNLRLQVEKPRIPAMESLGPWNYAIHHAETADNLYSDIVWVDHTR